jgi:hypothetical protein
MGATPGKLALVGVLAVALVLVIVVQMPDDSNVAQTATASVGKKPELDKSSDDKTESDKGTELSEQTANDKLPRHWPELTMETITALDPLTAPPWYIAAAHIEPAKEQDNLSLALAEEEARAAALATLQQAGATIVLISNGERIATIGDQRIRIGDNIEGFQVSDITDQGVVLTRPKPR